MGRLNFSICNAITAKAIFILFIRGRIMLRKKSTTHTTLSIGLKFKRALIDSPDFITIRKLIAFDLKKGKFNLPSASKFVDECRMDKTMSAIQLLEYADYLEYFLYAINVERGFCDPETDINGTFEPKFSFYSYKQKKKANSSGSPPPAYNMSFEPSR
jgi:hypothetical protein